jgi:hypothetical protein
MSEVESKPVTPADCALLLAIPLDRESFLADLSNPTKDFVRHFKLDGRANQTNESVWEAYLPYATLATEVCKEVKGLGVQVALSATLKDLHRLVAKWEVVTLVAHWRSALFRAEDIKSLDQVKNLLVEKGILSKDEMTKHNDSNSLAKHLNLILQTKDERFDDVLENSPGEAAAKQLKWHVRRHELEQHLGNSVVGGAGVEFADAFRDLQSIVTGFPVEFSGVLDLTVCQSVVLGEEVRIRCKGSQPLASVGKTSFDFRLALYAQVINLLAQTPMAYEEAVLKTRKALIKRYGRKNRANKKLTRRS